MEQKLELSKTAFWDVNFSEINFKKDDVFIVSKVFNRGLWNDMKWCVDTYGEDRVKEILKSIPYLNDDRLRLCTVIFNLKQNEFRCYIKKQLTPIPGGF